MRVPRGVAVLLSLSVLAALGLPGPAAALSRVSPALSFGGYSLRVGTGTPARPVAVTATVRSSAPFPKLSATRLRFVVEVSRDGVSYRRIYARSSGFPASRRLTLSVTVSDASTSTLGYYPFVRVRAIWPGNSRTLPRTLTGASVSVRWPPPVAWTTIHHVSPTGTATYAASLAQGAYCSMAAALAEAQPGDAVSVAAGDYGVRYAMYRSGTASAPISWRMDPGAVFTQGLSVGGSYNAVDGLEIAGGTPTLPDDRNGQLMVAGNHNAFTRLSVHDVSRASGVSFQYGASGNSIDGFSIDGTEDYGITVTEADHTTVRNGSITRYRGFSGIEERGSYNLYEGIRFFAPTGGLEMRDAAGTLVNMGDGDGIRINESRYATVRGCVFHPLFQLYSSLQHTDMIQSWMDVTGAVVEDCVLGTWQPDGIAGQGFLGSSNGIMVESKTSDPVQITFRNNVFLGMLWYMTTMGKSNPGPITLDFVNNTFWSRPPVIAGGPLAAMRFRNNAFLYTPGSAESYGYGLPGTIDSDYNAYSGTPMPWDGPHSFSVGGAANFGFAGDSDVTAASDWGLNTDWHPLPTSRLADAGVLDGSVPSADKDGKARDALPDIGAFEH